MKVENIKIDPLVTVVIPTYNRGDIIKKSIYSILDQTYKNFELIIVDDCSTDNTKEVIEKFTDKRIKYFCQSINQGSNAARNRGIQESKGEFIAFQDSDDKWLPNKLEILIDRFKKTDDDVGVIFAKTRGNKFDGKTSIFPNCEDIPTDFRKYLLCQNYVCTVSLIVRKKYLLEIGGFDEDLPRLQDWDLAIRLSRITKFKFVNKVLVDAFHQKVSISADSNKLRKAIEFLYSKNKHEINALPVKFKCKVLNKYGSLLFKEGITKEGRSFLIKSFRCNPLYLKNSFQLILSFMGPDIYRSLLFKVFRKKHL